MEGRDEANEFFVDVCEAVQQIPYGKVTTYGHIALLIGQPQKPRQVGMCLKRLPQNLGAHFNHENVPWQRVVNAKASISPRSRQSGAQDQAVALQAEGVRVVDNRASGSGFTVDFEECGWFPNRLPSEEEEEDEYLVNTDMNH
ncbi:DNA binding methylated-DNA--cysteine S-methyltransferase [Annulohypoxylon nitens]|nr:DNA binding methylated-DNA--cysteine S-methyltransferase [Annulohypoxylon nitens]